LDYEPFLHNIDFKYSNTIKNIKLIDTKYNKNKYIRTTKVNTNEEIKGNGIYFNNIFVSKISLLSLSTVDLIKLCKYLGFIINYFLYNSFYYFFKLNFFKNIEIFNIEFLIFKKPKLVFFKKFLLNNKKLIKIKFNNLINHVKINKNESKYGFYFFDKKSLQFNKIINSKKMKKEIDYFNFKLLGTFSGDSIIFKNKLKKIYFNFKNFNKYLNSKIFNKNKIHNVKNKKIVFLKNEKFKKKKESISCLNYNYFLSYKNLIPINIKNYTLNEKNKNLDNVINNLNFKSIGSVFFFKKNIKLIKNINFIELSVLYNVFSVYGKNITLDFVNRFIKNIRPDNSIIYNLRYILNLIFFYFNCNIIIDKNNKFNKKFGIENIIIKDFSINYKNNLLINKNKIKYLKDYLYQKYAKDLFKFLEFTSNVSSFKPFSNLKNIKKEELFINNSQINLI
jgi:hypothetical protein